MVSILHKSYNDIIMIFHTVLSLCFLSFTVIFLGTLLFVGFYFIIRAFKVKANNFYISGLAWLLMAFGQLLNHFFDFPAEIYLIFSKLSFIFLVIFTALTFHKERNSNFIRLIILISIITAILSWYLDTLREISQYFYLLSRIFDFVHGSIALDWLAISCYVAYTKIKDMDIAPWVKVRYKLISITSPILSIVYLILIFHPYDIPFGDLSTMQSAITYALTSIITLIYGVSFVISWIMPNRIKKMINRNYEHKEELEMTEDELMALVRKQLSGGALNGNN